MMKKAILIISVIVISIVVNAQKYTVPVAGLNIGASTFSGKSGLVPELAVDLMGLHISYGTTKVHDKGTGSSDFNNPSFTGDYELKNIKIGFTSILFERFMFRPFWNNQVYYEIHNDFETGVLIKDSGSVQNNTSLGLDLGYIFKDYFIVSGGITTGGVFNAKIGIIYPLGLNKR